MADETATISDNTTEPTEQATTPTPAPTPASAPKPHAPSPAAFAKKAVKRPAPAASASSYSDAEVKAAEAFGRVDDNGTVYVREGDSEREVGQFPDVSKEEALSLYARRYLDLKAKLDLLASRLHSDTVKSHEIDETLKSLEQETDKPAAVGDMASSQAVDMAMACGMTRKQAILKVALRLATPQLVSVIGLTFAHMVTGVMVVENLFALPGLGAMLVTDVGNRDLTSVQSELFLLAALFLLLGFAVDLAHRALDPRLKSAGVGSQEVSA